MSVNSLSASNTSLPPFPLSSSSTTMFSDIQTCMMSSVGYFNIIPFTFTNILLLPLYILVLHLGLQRWRRQRSSTMMSHSDLITYNMIATELLSIFGFILICCSYPTDLPQMMLLGIYLLSMKLFGQLLFHPLTCVERYLAVIHPITYLSLRTAKGIRVRNIVICCVWLACLAWPSLVFMLAISSINTLYVCVAASAIIVISFSSLSVLGVLIRPGPGGRDRQQVDQSKLKAFYTIMAISGVLLVRFGGSILSSVLYDLPVLDRGERCGVRLSVLWFSLPCSLVSPLLFLHRAGKLVCCKDNNTSGQGSD